MILEKVKDLAIAYAKKYFNSLEYNFRILG